MITNTWFKKGNTKLYTWKSPGEIYSKTMMDMGYKNLIDHKKSLSFWEKYFEKLYDRESRSDNIEDEEEEEMNEDDKGSCNVEE